MASIWRGTGLDDPGIGRAETHGSRSLSQLGLSGLTSSHWTSRPHGFSEARDDGFRNPGDEAVSEWRLDADAIKKGQALLISEAWQKHDRARKLISKGGVNAVMEMEWRRRWTLS